VCTATGCISRIPNSTDIMEESDTVNTRVSETIEACE